MTDRQLAISYNENTPIGVVSNDSYNFLFYDKFFTDFKVVTPMKQGWLDDVGMRGENQRLFSAPMKSMDSVSKVMQSKKFIDYFKTDRKRKFVMYSPIDPPYKINPLAYLMNSPTIAHAYENKRYFRDEFADLIRMPEYEIRYMSELDRAASYKDLADRYGAFMLQDEESSGSKGTYAIKSHDDYVEAIKSLKKFSRGRTIVVSKFVHGETSSIQVCVTKYGIFSGGIQRQLIDSPELCNVKLAGATKWCGGEVGAVYPDIIQHQAREMASIVGSELASHGYRGIFGLDVIVTPENEVYAIEINARLTGYSHVISDLQYCEGKIPFMLLHLFELGNYKYEVTDTEALPSISQYKKPASLLIVNNPLEESLQLAHYIKPGIYKLKGDKVVYLRPGYSLADIAHDDELIISSRYGEGQEIGSGRRILKIMKFGETMKNGQLNSKAKKLVSAVKNTFDLPQ
jgi:hypothetical protein